MSLANEHLQRFGGAAKMAAPISACCRQAFPLVMPLLPRVEVRREGVEAFRWALCVLLGAPSALLLPLNYLSLLFARQWMSYPGIGSILARTESPRRFGGKPPGGSLGGGAARALVSSPV